MRHAWWLALVLVPAAPAPAAAAIAFSACSGGIQCATVTVPLDRSGNVPGTLGIAVYRAPARVQPARGVLVGLPGGPGDSGRSYFLRRLAGFDEARATHDLVFLDPRGTGASGGLECVDTETCAAVLGEARSLYTSRDIADDVEAVRAALGAETIALYGISYGTWLAQTYARRYRDRVGGLILDGVVSARSQDDPFRAGLFRALPGATRSICGNGACRGITDDPHADLSALVRAAGRRGIGGTAFDPAGRPRRETASVAAVALAVANLDVNPPLRAELPAALAAARRDDTAPLLRLVAAGGLQPPLDPALTSVGANIVTQCEEVGLPWARTAPVGERLAEARRRIAAIPASAFRPVGRDLALAAGLAPLCERWPAAAADPLDRRPLPDVPALLLAGDADLRTPAADAADVARGLPRAHALLVRNTGHGALVEDPSGCASRAAAAFLARTVLPRGCPRSPLLPRPAFAHTLDDVPAHAVRGPRDLRARVVAAAVMTATDALNQAAMRIDSYRGRVRTVRFGGLRGGSVSGSLGSVRLSGAVYARGVAVTGTATAAGRYDLAVRGRMAGSLRVRDRRVTGTLGGRRVQATVLTRALGGAGTRVEAIL